MINASNLTERNAAIFKGLWLGDSGEVILVGLAYLALACRPQLATHALLALLAALPLASAAAIYYTIGNFPPGHLLLISAALAIGAALLPAKQTEAGQVVR